MSHKFGIFVNMNYTDKPAGDCIKILNKIKDKLLSKGYTFEKRVFVIRTEKDIKDAAKDVHHLLAEIAIEVKNLHSYLTDCYMLDIEKYADLKLPDTSESIEVEQITLDDLVIKGVRVN
jgi:pyruvate-formate lyase-activating enzyme